MQITKLLQDPGQDRKKDPEVLRLQRELKSLGYDPGPLDGKHGTKTTEATVEFAKWRNRAKPIPNPKLREDGVVDKALADYLNAQFYVSEVGKIVKAREDSLHLKVARIAQIEAGIAKKPKPKRELVLRRRLHKWMERLLPELEADLFEELRGYDEVAFAPEDEFASNGEFVTVIPGNEEWKAGLDGEEQQTA